MAKQQRLEINHRELLLAVNETTGSHSSIVWTAGMVLVEYLTDNKQVRSLKAKHILELGSGTGIAGLFCAQCGAASVHMTDLPDWLDLLMANVANNLPSIRSINPLVDLKATSLDWCSTVRNEQLLVQYDIILASDCIYSYALLDAFIAKLVLYSNRRTVVFVCSEMRDPELYNEFKLRLKQFFTVKKTKLKNMQYHTESSDLLRCKLIASSD